MNSSLILTDPNGNPVASNAGSLNATADSQIIYTMPSTLPGDGQYTIQATTDGPGQSGPYTLSLNCSPTAPAPSIEVTDGGSVIPNDGAISFGATPQGTPVTQTIDIVNNGIVDVALTGGGGTGDFTSNTALPPIIESGQSIPYTITFNASVAGPEGGVLTINSTAADSPYTAIMEGTSTVAVQSGVAVDGLTAAAGNGQVVLSWIPWSDTVTYSVFRTTTSGGEPGTTAIASGLTGLTYTDTNVSNGTAYYYTYQVYDITTGITSGMSNEVEATPMSVAPAVPTGLAAMPDESQITLVWNPTFGATSYNVYESLSTGGEGSTPYQTGLTSTSFTDTGLTDGTTYFYTVAAVDSVGTSPQSAEVSAIPPGIILNAVACSNCGIMLYWTGLPGAVGYDVYRSTISGGPYTELNTSPVSTQDTGPGVTNMYEYVDTTLTTCSTNTTVSPPYFYVVRAVNAGGTETETSNEASATPNTSALPWDTADPVQIVAQAVQILDGSLPPNIDMTTGEAVYPIDPGVVTVAAPDGVQYQGNYYDGSAPAAYPQSIYYDSNGGLLEFADGTPPTAAPGDTDEDGADGNESDTVRTRSLSPRDTTVVDTYMNGNDTGIWRKVMSAGGATGMRGLAGLPDVGDLSSGVYLKDDWVYPVGYKDSRGYPESGIYTDTACIYSGGEVMNDPHGNTYSLDAGLIATPNTGNPNWTPGWVPFVNGEPGTNFVSAYLADGTVIGTDGNWNWKGYKIWAQNKVWIVFATPNATHSDNMVALSLFTPIDDDFISGGPLGVVWLSHYSGGGGFDSTVAIQDATLFAYVPGWPQAGEFEVKRTNSIAQTMSHWNITPFVDNNLPKPNAPASDLPRYRGFLADDSMVYGAYWGHADYLGVQVDIAGWKSWDNDSLRTSASGSYPSANNGTGGYVMEWNEPNPFTWETGIDMFCGNQP